MTATDRINPRAKSRLTDMVQLSQSYARLTELELAAEGKVKLDSIATDLPDLLQQFVAAEEARQAESEARRSETMALVRELSARGEMPEELAKVIAVTGNVCGW